MTTSMVLLALLQAPDVERKTKRLDELLAGLATVLYDAKANARGHLQQLKTAAVALEKAAGDAKDVALWTRLGIAWWVLGVADRAEAAFSKSLAAAPADVRANYGLGRLLARIAMGRQGSREAADSDALRELRARAGAALEKSLTSGAGLGALEQLEAKALLLAMAAEDDDALKLIDDTLARHADAAGVEELWLLRGWLRKDGRLDAYRRALERRPNYPFAAVQRALVHEAAGEIEAAIAAYSDALRVRPDYMSALSGRGMLHYQKGQPQTAVIDFMTYTREWPDDPYGHYRLGFMRQMSKQFDQAIKAYGEAIRLDPKHVEAWINRALTKRLTKDLDGAAADLEEALRLDPKKPEAWHNRAVLREERGDAEGAIADFRKTLEVAPPDWPRRASIEEELRRLGADK